MALWREPKRLRMDNQRPNTKEKCIMKYDIYTYHDYLQQLLPESNFNLDVFNGTEQPCEITCNLCGAHHSFSCAALIARRARRNCKNVCKNCEKNNWTLAQSTAKHKAQYLLKMKGTIQLIDGLITWGSKQPATWQCTKCGHLFKRSPAIMFNQNILSCPWCETHPFKDSNEMIIEKAQELWGTEYSILDILQATNKNGSKRILVSHNKCGFKYEVNLWNFLHGQGCPRCKSSHGERRVRNYLIKNKFYFQEQYPITINNTILKLDFYLEESDNKFAIEYNGIQHYQPVDFFNGAAGYAKQIERDKLKEKYCIENNIQLIIIPYNDESIINSDVLAQRLHGQVA